MNRSDMFDFDRLASIKDQTEAVDFINGEIQRIQYLPLSEALVNRGRRGARVLEEIERIAEDGLPDPITGEINGGERYQFTLRVLKNKWGEKPKPGDTITWKRQLFYRSEGAKGQALSFREIDDRVRRMPKGTPNRWHVKGAAKVDKNGCISVRFSDAEQLLNLHGVYWLNNTAISKKRDITTHPQKNPDTNKMSLVHNWRFVEVPKKPKRKGN